MVYDKKLEFLKNSIKDNLFSFDLLLCFFISALNSFRHDTLLRPFPPNYFKNHEVNHTEKDFEKLKSDVSSLVFLEKIALGNVKPKETILKLLCWLFDTKKFKLKLCDKNEFQQLKEKVGSSYKSATPSHVFEVQHSLDAEERFESVRGGRKLLYAFHGSRLENFHSILHYGLSGILNKTALFGEGTYLASELSLCLDYSPYGQSWSGSVLGQRLSCVAVCQMVDCEFVKCQAEKLDSRDQGGSTKDSSRNKRRARIEGSLGGDIPEKYYIVTNDDVIRLKYILVYASRDKHPRSTNPPWYVRHSFVLMLLTYLVILVSIGLHKSPYLHSLLKHLTSND